MEVTILRLARSGVPLRLTSRILTGGPSGKTLQQSSSWARRRRPPITPIRRAVNRVAPSTWLTIRAIRAATRRKASPASTIFTAKKATGKGRGRVVEVPRKARQGKRVQRRDAPIPLSHITHPRCYAHAVPFREAINSLAAQSCSVGTARCSLWPFDLLAGAKSTWC